MRMVYVLLYRVHYIYWPVRLIFKPGLFGYNIPIPKCFSMRFRGAENGFLSYVHCPKHSNTQCGSAPNASNNGPAHNDELDFLNLVGDHDRSSVPARWACWLSCPADRHGCQCLWFLLVSKRFQTRSVAQDLQEHRGHSTTAMWVEGPLWDSR